MQPTYKITPPILNGLLALGILLAATLGGQFGHVSLSSSQFFSGLVGQSDAATNLIVQELRAPRILLGALCGAVLGYAGALLQGLLRNPLADPGVLGISSSAGLGAVITIYFGIAATSALGIALGAISGALIATGVLAFIAMRDSSILTLILAGVGLSSIAAAGISLVLNFAPNPMTLQEMILWMMGSLENRTYLDLMLATPLIVLGGLLVMGAGRGLNALSFGEETAQTLGINVSKLRTRIVVGTAIAVGATVSVAGAIGFIGLVVPHFVRTLIGSEPKLILVPSALFGALILMLADILTRLPFGAGQLRLGVVMAVIGAPIFLYIVFKTRDAMR